MGAGSNTGSIAPRGGNRAKLGLLAALAVAAILIIPATTLAAKGGGASSPSLAVAAVVSRSTSGGGSLRVSGSHFTPSAGGQQVLLWVGYPNDYCSADFTVCHGFYAYPWVNADGTFSLAYDDVPMQAGKGSVSASQWSASRHKWVQVANAAYSVP
jgi:hypothetical protein